MRHATLWFTKGENMNEQKLTQLTSAGFFATCAMLVFNCGLQLMGFSAPDYAGTWGTLLNAREFPELASAPWFGGLIWHFLNGAVLFPLGFWLAVEPTAFTRERSTKGLAWAGLLWLGFESFIAPIAGLGFFHQLVDYRVIYAVSDLLSWAMYGWVFEGLTRQPLHVASVVEEHYEEEHEYRNAA